jgi:hypothetical protein
MRYLAPAVGLVLVGVMVLVPSSVRADAPANLLLNGSAEQGQAANLPAVWSAASVPADDLTMERTNATSQSGKYALRIANEHDYGRKVSNNWMQEARTVPRGKAICLEASLRTEDADAANVCVQCWSAEPKRMLGFASTPLIRGTQNWQNLRSLAIVVPPDTKRIVVRAALTGCGQVWFDDISLTVVDEEIGHAAEPGQPQDKERKLLAELAGGTIAQTLPITKDCMVLSYLPEWAHGRVDNIAVANSGGGVRTLLAWGDLPTLAVSGGNRTLLALYSRKTTSDPNPGVVQVRRLEEPWRELTSWKTQPGSSEETVSEHDFVAEEGWKLFDVTPLVRAQAQSAEECHGVMLRFEREDFVPGTHSGYAFVSREGLGEWATKHPRLLIVARQ